ncbi:MAG: hypothetical protein OEP48_15665 [Betaproteobacteria bacterium]|nr:hypothetical protein [Betaproteobacteria bacterium]MDH3436626.1 hypothetical protein [Betaproteobacteria bacterium]
MDFLRRLVIVVMAAALAPAAAAQQVERIMNRDGILYISGGIGVSSQERLKMLEPQFNLKLVFTLTEGNYLGDVNVALKDAGGKLLLEHVTEGPIFMVRVPAGSYSVSATYSGSPQSRTIKAAEKLRTEYFRWSGDARTQAPVRADGKGGGAAQPKMPAGDTVSVVSGGIGADEMAELTAKEGQYNLKLVFSLIEGNYIADVNVVVKRAAGTVVLEHFAEGPIFMARLPAGTYSASVTYQGKAQTRSIKVGEKLRTEHFRWASNPETDLPVSRWLEPETEGSSEAPRAR